MNNVKGWHIILASFIIGICFISGNALRSYSYYQLIMNECAETTQNQQPANIPNKPKRINT